MRFTSIHGAFVVFCIISYCCGQDYSCSPTKHCALGCCGKNNVCGLGPSYCAAENCTSSCNQLSECDPGWGSKWSSSEKCPLNVCCSKFGKRLCLEMSQLILIAHRDRILWNDFRLLRYANRGQTFLFGHFIESKDCWVLRRLERHTSMRSLVSAE